MLIYTGYALNFLSKFRGKIDFQKTVLSEAKRLCCSWGVRNKENEEDSGHRHISPFPVNVFPRSSAKFLNQQYAFLCEFCGCIRTGKEGWLCATAMWVRKEVLCRCTSPEKERNVRK